MTIREDSKISCGVCGSKNVIPCLAVCGSSSPMRVFDLSLLGKVYLQVPRSGMKSPLWACGECLTPIPKPVRGDGEAAVKPWYAAVQVIFESYVPLPVDQRDMLFVEKELRQLLTDLNYRRGTHLIMLRNLDDVIIRRIDEPGEDLRACDEKTWRNTLQLCNPRREIRSYDGTAWTVIVETSSDRGEYLEVIAF